MYESMIRDIKKELKETEFRCNMLEEKNEEIFKMHEGLLSLTKTRDLHEILKFIHGNISN